MEIIQHQFAPLALKHGHTTQDSDAIARARATLNLAKGGA